MHLFKNSSHCLLDLLIENILAINAREDILKEEFEFPHISKGQFGESIDPDSLNEQLTLGLEGGFHFGTRSLLEDEPTGY